jgi:sortase A
VSFLTRYAGHALLIAGFLLFSTVLRSAAGPADLLGGQRVAAPATGAATLATGPRLIASPRRAGENGAAPLLAVPTAEPTEVPTEVPTVQPTVAPPTPVPTPEPPPVSTGRITIPRIAVDAKVVDVGVLPSGEMETAAFAAGRLGASAQAGEPGNAVIAGHNDIQGEVFRRLPELQVGDEIVLYRGATAYHYRVQLRSIVREDGATDAQRRENARWMEPTDVAAVTLISCYPYRVDTHRIIVRGTLVG